MLEPFRAEMVPKHILQKVRSLLKDGHTLPPNQILLYTRALHKSLVPRIRPAPEGETFQWNVYPPHDGIPHGRVYMDGSRLYAEHKYCNLIARQGWAFAVLDVDAVVIAAASGRTPQWANGIHATELWALLRAAPSITGA